MHTVLHGISQKIMKNVENEKCTLYDLEYGEKKSEKRGKWEMDTLGPGKCWEILKNVKWEKQL